MQPNAPEPSNPFDCSKCNQQPYCLKRNTSCECGSYAEHQIKHCGVKVADAMPKLNDAIQEIFGVAPHAESKPVDLLRS